MANEFRAKELTGVLWAFAGASWSERTLTGALARSAQLKAEHFRPAELATLAAAWARLGQMDSSSWAYRACLQRTTGAGRDAWSRLSADEVVATVWALAQAKKHGVEEMLDEAGALDAAATACVGLARAGRFTAGFVCTAVSPKLQCPGSLGTLGRDLRTYFNIEAAAEKVRLTLVMTGTDFEDKRIEFKDWATLKPTTPHGQLPMMTLTQPDGTETKFAQSVAMMRWVARKFDSSNTLYPADADAMLEIEELIGLSEDMARAWAPALYMGMGRHTSYGYPEDWPQKHATVKKLREEFLKDSLPKFMEFFTKKLEKTGTFFCGDQPTIADLQILAQLRYFTKGVADHVPADCLKPFPAITGWMDRMHAIPQIKAWYGK
ncbi:unnamed protein product [Durusdinium trenchii]|uniref:Glutathione transferase n=1 Tax=Durusdinium trenchii TaxID=1381693 RepID=A0ABP0Q3E5_9DINO